MTVADPVDAYNRAERDLRREKTRLRLQRGRVRAKAAEVAELKARCEAMGIGFAQD